MSGGAGGRHQRHARYGVPTIVCGIKQSNITGVNVTTTFYIIHNKFAAAVNINSASSLTALINRQFELEMWMTCDFEWIMSEFINIETV